MKRLLQRILKNLGYTVSKIQPESKSPTREELYPDIKEQEFWEIYDLCKPFTMTSVERMYALYLAVQYILTNNIDGDFVECGVWRGGSSMLTAKMLSNRNIKNRKLYLYDTFEGMSPPTNSDIAYNDETAQSLFETIVDENGKTTWCLANLTDVKNNMKLTKFPENNLIYVEGKVEDTIPNKLPETNLAMLRLDTDWYESTKHELVHLFPKLIKEGILIIDDYGYWKGCRKAVDEYFSEKKLSVLLNRIDMTGRILVKNFN